MAVLGNPKNTIEVLQKFNFNFQKKFGQNFLINTSILEQTCNYDANPNEKTSISPKRLGVLI